MSDPLYIKYHDTEWGVPLFDDQKIFADSGFEASGRAETAVVRYQWHDFWKYDGTLFFGKGKKSSPFSLLKFQFFPQKSYLR